MDEIKQFFQNERDRLEKINVYKVYYRTLIYYNPTEIDITITIKDTNYIDEYMTNYDYFIDKLTEMNTYPSLVPYNTWVSGDNESWGWEELSF